MADRGTARRDNIATLMAIGVLAYVGETLGHELIGHGGACLVSGGHITLLAPLWMRCNVVTIPLVAAGPLFNFVVGSLLAVAVRLGIGSDRSRYFLWLSAVFNLLVAFGYLIVGGATTFGDWGVVLGKIEPAWMWRVGAIFIGLAGYLASLRVLARLYGGMAGVAGLDDTANVRRTFVPGIAAAVVSCGAEIYGGRLQFMPLALALGCTVFVAWSVAGILGTNSARPTAGTAVIAIRMSPLWIAAAMLVAAAFILIVGPGVSLA